MLEAIITFIGKAAAIIGGGLFCLLIVALICTELEDDPDDKANYYRRF